MKLTTLTLLLLFPVLGFWAFYGGDQSPQDVQILLSLYALPVVGLFMVFLSGFFSPKRSMSVEPINFVHTPRRKSPPAQVRIIPKK